MIAVITASRGTMFSRTTESIFNNIYGKEAKLYMAHELPIPICFNYAFQKAYKDGCDYFWFVEEDMLVPDGTLDRLLATDEPVCGVDYADRRTGKSLTFKNKKGEVLYTGMGCLLVKREVMDKISPPWFKRMVFWIMDTDDGDVDYVPKPDIATTGYGTQDVMFCYEIRQLGYKINMLWDIPVGHMTLEKKGDDVINNGADMVKIIYPENGVKPDVMTEIGTVELSVNSPSYEHFSAKVKA